MPWDREPTVASPADVEAAASAEMRSAGLRLRTALQDGSAVDTGEFRGAWRVTTTDSEVMATNGAPHARYAPLDTTAADRVADDLSRRLGASVNRAIAEGG